jgi:hypothetical protein
MLSASFLLPEVPFPSELQRTCQTVKAGQDRTWQRTPERRNPQPGAWVALRRALEQPEVIDKSAVVTRRFECEL